MQWLPCKITVSVQNTQWLYRENIVYLYFILGGFFVVIVLCWGFELFLLLSSWGAVLAFTFSSHCIITSHAYFLYDSRIFHICVWSYNSLVTFCTRCLHWSFLFYLFTVNVQILIKLLFHHSFFLFPPPATPVPLSKPSNAPSVI